RDRRTSAGGGGRSGRGWPEELLDSRSYPPGDDLLVDGTGGDRAFEGIGQVKGLGDRAGHQAGGGEVAGQGRPDQQQVVVAGGGGGQPAGRGVAHRGAEAAVGEGAVVGDLPPLGVHGGNHVGLDQTGQALVGGGEGTGRVVEGDAARVLGAPAGVHVDADQGVGLGQVGAGVAGHDVVVGALDRQHPRVGVDRA